MLQLKENNGLDYASIFSESASTLKLIRIMMEGVASRPKTISEKRNEVINLLRQYNFDDGEILELLKASGFDNSKKDSKVIDINKLNKRSKSYRNIKAHVDFLHDHEGLQSWITVAHIDYALSEDGWHQWHYQTPDVLDQIAVLRNKKTSTYMSVNEFWKPQRNVLSLRYLTAFYADIDAHADGVEVDLKAVKRFLKKKYKEGVLPPHSKLSFTGRGVQIYWKIELSPASNLWLWQIVQSYIVEALMDIKDEVAGHSVDIQCVDCTRVFRVDDTYNPKAGCYSKSIEQNDNVYRMSDILNDYFKDKYTIRKRKKKANISQGEVQVSKDKVIVLNDRSEARMRLLRQRRCEDLKTLLELRKNKIQEGHREQFLFIYAWTAIENLNSYAWIYRELSSVNAMFTDPLPDTEIQKAAKKVFKKYTNKILKQTAKDGSLSKAIGRYTFRNGTIIDRLQITELERKSFVTILYKEEAKFVYNARRNEAKRKSRRDGQGLTDKERIALENSKEKLRIYQPYLDQGWGAKKIAKELEISLNTVKYDLRKIKERGLL